MVFSAKRAIANNAGQVKRTSVALNFQANYFAWFTLDEYLEWPAAYFAIRRETLGGGACVDY